MADQRKLKIDLSSGPVLVLRALVLLAVALVVHGRAPSMVLAWPVTGPVAAAILAYICYAATAVFLSWVLFAGRWRRIEIS